MTDPSPFRQLTLWLFKSPPFDPYVSVNVSIEFTHARSYLDRLNARADGPRITVQHLASALIGRLYREHPVANARVVGRRIYRLDRVGVLLPVDRSEHLTIGGMELSLALIEDADRRSLVDIAGRSRHTVHEERRGKPQHPVWRLVQPLAERTPPVVLEGVLDAADVVLRSRLVQPLANRLLPVSVVITNPGAVFRKIPGGRFVSASFSPPARFLPLGSLFGISAVQDEVIAEGGLAVVRPMLPVSYVFDHRLFDGVMASKILLRLAQMFQAPADVLGEGGDRVG